MVSVNFITTDLTGLIYFRLTPGGYFLDRLLTWISYMLRVLFWAGIFHGFQKKLSRMAGLMTAKIWLAPGYDLHGGFYREHYGNLHSQD